MVERGSRYGWGGVTGGAVAGIEFTPSGPYVADWDVEVDTVIREESGVLLRVGEWVEGEKRTDGADAEGVILGERDGPRSCVFVLSVRVVGSEGADDGGIGSILD
jgi:hypothetical protein